jgi:phage gp29-like protein
MNGYEMVVVIVLIASIGGVLKAIFNGGGRKHERIMRSIAQMQPPPQADPEAARLREDVRGLKERVAVLERLITDQSSSLDREFEKLKQMD